MNSKYLILILTPLLFTQLACKKWLDVKPKSQIESDVLYQRESGYKDVLYGAYVNMASTAMYGREMTFGLVDVIGNAYAGTGSSYNYARTFQYTEQGTEIMINNVWQRSYNTIANINNLVEHLHTADRAMFAADNYNVILGEALGLRAMLHFDLLRLFAPSFKSNPAGVGIPYVTRYGFGITGQSSVAVTIDSIMTDLNQAASLLKLSDPIVTNRVITALTDDGYLLNRNYKFNYYAVKMAQARVFMYKQDIANAALCADEVIDSGKFKWITVDAVAVADEAKRDRTFSTEQVFVLNVPRLSEFIATALVPNPIGLAGAYSAHFFTANINTLYPDANDWRKLYFFSQERSGFSPERYCNKLWQPTGMPQALTARLPMMRLPELFLLSAEAALATTPSKTITRLRELRIHRGLDAGIPDNTPAETLQTEIKNQYRREFICEGQLFYYYKRNDAATMDGVTGSFNKASYVLPKPAEEIEFR